MKAEYGDDLTGGIRGKYLGFCLNELSSSRLTRLLQRHPELSSSSIFGRLTYIQRSASGQLTMTDAELDAVASILLLLNAEPNLGKERVDQILDLFVSKIPAAPGPSYDVHQYADFAYEGQIGMLLASQMASWLVIPSPAERGADLGYQVQFLNTETLNKYSIECKNLRTYTEDPKKLATAASRAIIKAVKQQKHRGKSISNLIVFVDLPVGVLSFSKPQFYSFVVNVFRQISQRNLIGFSETQVVFTATWQENMADHILKGDPDHRQMHVFVPHLVNKTSIRMSPAHNFFLSALFRTERESISVENWSKCAVQVPDPESFVS